MKCRRCQAENREAARFCRECGATFAHVCSSCGANVAAGSKFCDGCGVLLAPPGAAGPGPARFAVPESSTPKHVRIGLHSGEVVVRSIGSDLHMDYTAVGQTTHLAARMEQAALPGSILVTADTMRLAEGFVTVKSLGPLAIKGLSEGVDAYEVIGAGTARTRFQAAGARGLTRFVGRGDELTALDAGLRRALEGHGIAMGVVGAAGVGKSSLCQKFVERSRSRSLPV